MKIYHKNGESLYTAREIERVIIYSNGERLYTSDNSRLECYELTRSADGREDKLRSIYNGGPVEIALTGEIVHARKENLNRRDNYTLAYFADYDKSRARTALYIHASELASFADLGNVLSMETSEEKCYLHAVKIAFARPVVFDRLHAEKIPLKDGEIWSLPAGGRWSSAYGTEAAPTFDTYDTTNSPFAARKGIPAENGIIKRWITRERVEGAVMVCAERYYTKIEYSPERERKNALAEALNKSGAFHNQTFSHYDIDKLEGVFGKLSIVEK